MHVYVCKAGTDRLTNFKLGNLVIKAVNNWPDVRRPHVTMLSNCQFATFSCYY